MADIETSLTEQLAAEKRKSVSLQHSLNTAMRDFIDIRTAMKEAAGEPTDYVEYNLDTSVADEQHMLISWTMTRLNTLNGLIVDGESCPLDSSYIHMFSSAGKHSVKYVINNGAYLNTWDIPEYNTIPITAITDVNIKNTIPGYMAYGLHFLTDVSGLRFMGKMGGEQPNNI